MLDSFPIVTLIPEVLLVVSIPLIYSCIAIIGGIYMARVRRISSILCHIEGRLQVVVGGEVVPTLSGTLAQTHDANH